MAGAHLHPGDVGTLHVHLGGGGDDVAGVHTADRDAGQLERSGDQEQSRRELSQANDPLSSKPSGEQDQDGSRGDGSPQLRLPAGELALERLAHILGRVELRLDLGDRLLGGLRVHRQLSSILLLDRPDAPADRKTRRERRVSACIGGFPGQMAEAHVVAISRRSDRAKRRQRTSTAALKNIHRSRSGERDRSRRISPSCGWRRPEWDDDFPAARRSDPGRSASIVANERLDGYERPPLPQRRPQPTADGKIVTLRIRRKAAPCCPCSCIRTACGRTWTVRGPQCSSRDQQPCWGH